MLAFTLIEIIILVLILAMLVALIGAAAAGVWNKTKTVVTGGTLIQTATLVTGGIQLPVNGSGAGIYIALRKTNNAPAANSATTLTVIPLMPLLGTLTIAPAATPTDQFGIINFTITSTNYEGPVLLVITDTTSGDTLPMTLVVK